MTFEQIWIYYNTFLEKGEILYKESEIILSERCSVTGKTDDFDCKNCALYKAFLSGNKNKS